MSFSFNQKLTLTHQQMASDYEKLRQDETDKSSKLQELMSVSNTIIESPLKQYYSPTNHNNQYRNNIPSSPTINQQLTPKHLFRAISPAHKYLHGPDVIDNCLLDKSRKNFYNSSQRLSRHMSAQSLLLASSAANSDNEDDDNVDGLLPIKMRRRSLTNCSLLATLCRNVPLALPTLQLHLLISLTMVLLTHRCPQYLIVL